jgi:hypothetical protein
MFCRESLSRRTALRWLFAATALMPSLLALGCASPGQPQPPSLNLPEQAQKMGAERVGDQVVLSWTTSANTTDGARVRGPVVAVVCLDTAASASASASKKPVKRGQRRATTEPSNEATVPCNEVQRVKVTPGPGKATADLATGLATGPATLLGYRIKLENDKSRSSGSSAPVFAAGGAAPPAVGPLDVSARREGALVRWQPQPGEAAMELKRTLVATPDGPLDASAAKSAKVAGSMTPGAGKEPAREAVLRIDAGKDAGGLIDRGAVDGDTYSYVAQRIATVTVGGHTLELRSMASPPATFTFHDTFPPQAPTGLVLVPGGGFGESRSIDLAWDANLETDMLGYNVYRSEGAGFVRLNAELVQAPAYRDMQVQPGHTYTYRVTAVDRRHNESVPGAEVQETLRK